MKTDPPENHPSLLAALKNRVVRPLPVWLMRQAGRYLPEYRELRARAGSFWDLCNTPALAAEATLQPIRRFAFDAAIVFSDILTVPVALGQAVRIEEGIGPRLAPFPGTDVLVADGPSRARSLMPVYDTLRRVRAELPTATALIGFAGAPWTLATYMLGKNRKAEERLVQVRKLTRESEFASLLAVLVETVADHLVAQVEAGADAVQIFDSWAGGLNDEEFDHGVISPTRTIVEQVRERCAAPVIGFPRGATLEQQAAYARNTGVDGLSLSTEIPLAQAFAHTGGITLQGNLDPHHLVAGGPVLDEAVDAIVAAARGRPFIFNLGHGVLPETPVEHVAQLVRRVRGDSGS